ncbi:MAG: hypothetical protein OER90_05505 [Gemmatimonadota bacterium]|nr:hypothetical protein [Gemmatimonadota bacterium]
MRRHISIISGMAAALALTLSACSESPLGVNAGDQLSDAEIQALFNQLGEALGDPSPSASVAAPEGLQLTEIRVNQDVSVTAPCQSGTISLDGSVSGTIDDQTLEGDLRMGVSVDFDACTFPAEQITVTVDGAPKIEFQADYLFAQESFSVEGYQRGGFEFTTSDGRVGSCAIDLTFDASYTTGSATVSTMNGTVCGRSAASFEGYTGA